MPTFFLARLELLLYSIDCNNGMLNSAIYIERSGFTKRQRQYALEAGTGKPVALEYRKQFVGFCYFKLTKCGIYKL